MKRLLTLLDQKLSDKLNDAYDYIIIKLNLEDRDRITIHSHKPKVKTIHPENRISQDEWFSEFNVSMLYDRKIVHID